MPPKQKNHMELGRGCKVSTRTQYPVWWDDHYIFFKQWITKLVACGVALSSNSTSLLFRTKSFQHLFVPYRINTNGVFNFVIRKKALMRRYCEMAHHTVAYSKCSDFVICQLGLSTDQQCMFRLFTHSFNSKCTSSLKNFPYLPVIANAKTISKNLSIWQNQFLSTLRQFTVCWGDNQDHALNIQCAVWSEKCNEEGACVNKVRLAVPS